MTRLNGVGVITSSRRIGNRAVEVAHAAESAGYDAIWVADVRGDLGVLGRLVDATDHLVAASGIVSMWDLPASDAAAAWSAADALGPGRVLVGIGVSHAFLAEQAGHTYDRPLSRLGSYLDELDSLPDKGIPVGQRLIGANGPKMLNLAAERTAGAVTYMVTPERTANQRETLGPEAVLAPEVKVALASDRAGTRELGRAHLAGYLKMPNYLSNLVRMGFTENDFANGGSDRLVDALIAGPTVDDVVTRIAEHRDAGADQPCLHVLVSDGTVPLDLWREIAPAVTVPAATN